MAAICKGTVLTTKKACTKLAITNGFCGKHQEQSFIFEAREKGETVCRYFERGCRNYLSNEDKECKFVKCKVCRDRLLGKETPCEHKGCTFKTEGKNRFCGKHVRDVYHEKATDKGIRYCNIDRGCASILKESETACTRCNEAIKQNITKQLHDLRMVEENCLKCRTSPKSHGYFCNSCYPSIQFIKSTSKRDINNMWNDMYKGAIDRNILILLPYTSFSEITIQPCFYCGKFSEEGFNGIDRYDNDNGYVLSNVKPCCTDCNMMKRDMPAEAFLDKVKSIIKFKNDNITISSKLFKKWKDIYRTKYAGTFIAYKNRTVNVRHISFTLSEEEYKELLQGACYLCGIETSDIHKNGIDRIDSTEGYSIKNCKSCCTHCNLMKNNSNLGDFITQCENITAYRCSPVSVSTKHISSTVKNEELYRSTDIYEFIQINTLSQFCLWAKEVGKTTQFIQGIREISDKKLDKSESLIEIQRQMDMERTRKYKMRDEEHETKHYSATSVHAMLINGEVDKFQTWYEKTFGISESFEEQLYSVVASIKSLITKEGIQLCRKFLKAENGRRTSILKETIKRNMKAPTKKKTWVANVISTPVANVISTPVANVISTPVANVVSTLVANVVSTPVENIMIDTSIKKVHAKQWKSTDIYKIIKAGNGEEYKYYCEEHNNIKDETLWKTKWGDFHKQVLKSTNFEEVKAYISSFILSLRKERHGVLLNKSKSDVLDRTDRIVWPKESVLKAFVDGKIDKFKEFNEANGESGDKWNARWQELINMLEGTTKESERLEIIRKFQVNVRVARYRSKK